MRCTCNKVGIMHCSSPSTSSSKNHLPVITYNPKYWRVNKTLKFYQASNHDLQSKNVYRSMQPWQSNAKIVLKLDSSDRILRKLLSAKLSAPEIITLKPQAALHIFVCLSACSRSSMEKEFTRQAVDLASWCCPAIRDLKICSSCSWKSEFTQERLSG